MPAGHRRSSHRLLDPKTCTARRAAATAHGSISLPSSAPTLTFQCAPALGTPVCVSRRLRYLLHVLLLVHPSQAPHHSLRFTIVGRTRLSPYFMLLSAHNISRDPRPRRQGSPARASSFLPSPPAMGVIEKHVTAPARMVRPASPPLLPPRDFFPPLLDSPAAQSVLPSTLKGTPSPLPPPAAWPRCAPPPRPSLPPLSPPPLPPPPSVAAVVAVVVVPAAGGGWRGQPPRRRRAPSPPRRHPHRDGAWSGGRRSTHPALPKDVPEGAVRGGHAQVMHRPPPRYHCHCPRG